MDRTKTCLRLQKEEAYSCTNGHKTNTLHLVMLSYGWAWWWPPRSLGSFYSVFYVNVSLPSFVIETQTSNSVGTTPFKNFPTYFTIIPPITESQIIHLSSDILPHFLLFGSVFYPKDRKISVATQNNSNNIVDGLAISSRILNGF
jgi:hypothetical protein